ncbi:hypothetical protein H671_6g17079 [Cricetulus griseus]|uniref:Uncharacterized protein n=1 Tax=Cricetulus griseus TaxID=10029 RepID=A0A061I0V9_CRIGR|nr:hypothetical protein H671_6g17079 [Cricetulus griseus]
MISSFVIANVWGIAISMIRTSLGNCEQDLLSQDKALTIDQRHKVTQVQLSKPGSPCLLTSLAVWIVG